MAAPKTTRIAGDTTQAVPQSTAAGDAPADTYDPLERVSSVNADKAAAAAADYLTVNAVEPVDSITATTSTGQRVEELTLRDQTGASVTQILDYDQGTSATLTTRANSEDYAAGVYIKEGTAIYEVTTAGATASSKPTFNAASIGATITDGTVTWTRRR